MTGLLRSELLKLVSTRTARWLVVSEVALVALLLAGALVSGSFPAAVLGTPAGFRRLLEHGGLTALLSLVLGVLISANEYRHGTIVDTFLTVPRRTPAVVAKLAAGAVVGLLGGLACAAVVLVTAVFWYGAQGVPFPVTAALISSLAGVAGWHLLYAVLGVATGLLLRSPAAAIVIALLWITVAETAVAQLVQSAGRWLPGTAARALGGDPEPGLLGQGSGALVLLGWALLLVVGAVQLTRRRDVH